MIFIWTCKKPLKLILLCTLGASEDCEITHVEPPQRGVPKRRIARARRRLIPDARHVTSHEDHPSSSTISKVSEGGTENSSKYVVSSYSTYGHSVYTSGHGPSHSRSVLSDDKVVVGEEHPMFPLFPAERRRVEREIEGCDAMPKEVEDETPISCGRFSGGRQRGRQRGRQKSMSSRVAQEVSAVQATSATSTRSRGRARGRPRGTSSYARGNSVAWGEGVENPKQCGRGKGATSEGERPVTHLQCSKVKASGEMIFYCFAW